VHLIRLNVPPKHQKSGWQEDKEIGIRQSMFRLDYLLVAGGGALGSAARYWLSGIIGRWFGETFPYGTLLVNISGCIAIGFFATLTGPEGRALVRPEWRLAFMSGVCGGYTTFSSFSLQTLNLGLEGDWLRAGANIVLSHALSGRGLDWAPLRRDD
jgi:CrcB protein